jgi:hypothetical protein
MNLKNRWSHDEVDALSARAWCDRMSILPSMWSAVVEHKTARDERNTDGGCLVMAKSDQFLLTCRTNRRDRMDYSGQRTDIIDRL